MKVVRSEIFAPHHSPSTHPDRKLNNQSGLSLQSCAEVSIKHPTAQLATVILGKVNRHIHTSCALISLVVVLGGCSNSPTAPTPVPTQQHHAAAATTTTLTVTPSPTTQTTTSSAKVQEPKSPATTPPEEAPRQTAVKTEPTQTGELPPESVLQPAIAAPEWLQGHWHGHAKAIEISPDGTAHFGETRQIEHAVDLRLRLIAAGGDKTNGYAEFQVEEEILNLHPYHPNEYPVGLYILFSVRDSALIDEGGHVGNFCGRDYVAGPDGPICGV